MNGKMCIFEFNNKFNYNRITGNLNCRDKTFDTSICGWNYLGDYDLEFNITRSHPITYFFALSRCSRNGGNSYLKLENYELILTNGNGFCKHLSYEQQGMLEFRFVYTLFYLLLTLFAFYVGYQLHLKLKFHILYGFVMYIVFIIVYLLYQHYCQICFIQFIFLIIVKLDIQK